MGGDEKRSLIAKANDENHQKGVQVMQEIENLKNESSSMDIFIF